MEEQRFVMQYHHRVVKEDIPNLSSAARERCKKAIEYRLSTKPQFFGKPLQSSLKYYRTLRVGPYRIVYRLEQGIVYILIIAHRSKVYTYALQRILGDL